MLNLQKTPERQALLMRLHELHAELVQHEGNLRDGEARLPVEEHYG
jgi:hypothetical protein